MVSREPIDFGTCWSKARGSKAKNPNNPEGTGQDPVEVERQVAGVGRFAAGFATDYAPRAVFSRCR